MTVYTCPPRNSSRTDKPFNPGQRRRSVVNSFGSEHAAKAARAAVFVEFGRHAFALDHADFVDRKPAERCGIIFVGSRFDGT